MKKLLITLMTVTLFIGCSDEKKEDKRGNVFGSNGSLGSDEETVDTTDYSACRGVAQVFNLDGSWSQKHESDNTRYQLTLQFNGTELKVSNQCAKNGVSATATGRTSLYHSGASFQTTSEIQQTVNNSVGGNEVTCPVRLDRGSFNYYFEGRCLVLKDGQGEQFKFVRW